jgi:hypothetical protein
MPAAEMGATTDDGRAPAWAGFLRWFLAVFAGTLVSLFAFIALMNPFGNLPVRAFSAHVIMDTNDRYQYPAIVRSGAFDSAVFGTSSSRLLDPAWLEGAFGGRFANLGFNDGRAWEQYQLALLFLRAVPKPRTMLFGIDWVWCESGADVNKVSTRGWPEWLYDEDPRNDWLHVFSFMGAKIATRQLANRAGLMPPRFPPNGFDVFVPPETAYDAVKARGYIWRGRQNPIVPVTPAYLPTEAERAGWRYPALAWLEEIATEAPADAALIFAFMPVHVAAQTRPGSQDAAKETECKARIAGIARRRGAPFIDFKIASPITREDGNYWDAMHNRLPIARRVAEDLAKAVATGRDDPAGDWVVLAPAARR